MVASVFTFEREKSNGRLTTRSSKRLKCASELESEHPQKRESRAKKRKRGVCSRVQVRERTHASEFEREHTQEREKREQREREKFYLHVRARERRHIR